MLLFFFTDQAGSTPSSRFTANTFVSIHSLYTVYILFSTFST